MFEATDIVEVQKNMRTFTVLVDETKQDGDDNELLYQKSENKLRVLLIKFMMKF